ncbi:DUF5818 domain-containing protein [Intrasporangium sp. YIM S08009]|uniref:DUF5818 domain-containing protein n=1 Tax=Intrasporangium zincisolvens TaxID=3080018 RepID=UPI002B061CCB|nr:DUF5818 domain-containing protein [Intrasporangium sp. YIM S08009]
MPQSFSDLAARSSTPSGDAAARASVTVAGTLRQADAGDSFPAGAAAASVLLVAEDGRTYALELPPGWSVDAEAGARVVVSGELTSEGTLRVRRIATA